MVHTYEAPTPEVKAQANPVFAERLLRKKRAFKTVGFSYAPDDFITKRRDAVEEESIALQEAFGPECVRIRLLNIKRVLLPQRNMFDTADIKADKTILDKEHSNKSAVVFKLQCDILNEEILRKSNAEALIDHRAARVTFTCGHIETPVLSPVYGDGKLKSMKISNWNNVFYIPDNPAQIKKILKEFGPPAKSYSVAIANPTGQSVNKNDETFTVFTEQDFINEPIELLIDSNRKNLLGRTTPGGVRKLLVWKDIEKRMLESGKATESELESITTEDIISVLTQKKTQQQQKQAQQIVHRNRR
jgi:hypothetical protein